MARRLGSNGSRRRGTLGTRAAAQEVAEEPTVFPAGEHRDEVFYFCTACHSSRLVRNQAMTRERWDVTLTWMTERHNMPAGGRGSGEVSRLPDAGIRAQRCHGAARARRSDGAAA